MVLLLFLSFLNDYKERINYCLSKRSVRRLLLLAFCTLAMNLDFYISVRDLPAFLIVAPHLMPFYKLPPLESWRVPCWCFAYSRKRCNKSWTALSQDLSPCIWWLLITLYSFQCSLLFAISCIRHFVVIDCRKLPSAALKSAAVSQRTYQVFFFYQWHILKFN